MLEEIYSPVFKIGKETRAPIHFEEGLNVVLGDDMPDNSIGKSSFLLAIDFAYGGITYPTKEIKTEIGDHIVYWTMSFDDGKHYFARNTAHKDTIIICRIEYKNNRNYYYATDNTISISEYEKFMFDHLKMTFDEQDYRVLTSLFMRIHPKPCSNRIDKPLRSFDGQKDEDGITELEKVMNYYEPIKKEKESKQEAQATAKALKDAEGRKIITRLTEKDVDKNKEKITELNKELKKLGYSEANEQENSISTSNEEITDINQNIKSLREHRFELYARRKVLSGSYVETVESIDGELTRLKRFFGDSIKCEEIENIQQFHLRIQAILKEESNEELQKIESDLAKTNQEISELMKKTIELDQPVGVSRSYIDEITDIKAEISKLEDLNRNYSAREKIRSTVGEAKNILQNVEKNYTVLMQNAINKTLSTFMKEMFPDTVPSIPTITISEKGSYSYQSYNDGGNGTSYRDLILFDLSIMKLSSLPVLIHDNNLTKTIGNKTVERIYMIYQEVSKDKQIFVSFDGLKNFDGEDMKKEINNCTRLRLSIADDNYLFGKKFNTNPPTKEEQMTLF